jgi:signal transduction histidine kinase
MGKYGPLHPFHSLYAWVRLIPHLIDFALREFVALRDDNGRLIPGIYRTFRVVFCLVAIVLWPAFTTSAETLPLKNYTTSDGLAHDSVNRIMRDSRGFLWFCTGEGLSRFDGYQFKNYTRDDGLPHRTITDILETRDGQYWLATGSGLVLFNPQGVKRRWTGKETEEEARDKSLMFRVFRAENVPAGKWALYINKILEDRKGNIWCAALNGLYKFEPNDRAQLLRRINRQPWQDKQAEFGGLLEDKSGAIWIAGFNALYRILPDGELQIVITNLSLFSFLEDSQGNIWVGARGDGKGGLYQFTYNGLQQPELLRIFTEKDGLTDHLWHFAILETTDKTLWVGIGNGLCKKVKSSGPDTTAFRPVLRTGVTTLEEDIGGNLWIGTESQGAFRLSRRGFTGFGEKDGLKSTRIDSIINGINSEVFVISGNKMIQHFDGEKFTAVSPLNMVQSSWGWNQYHFQDHLGEWWIAGGEGTGLQRYPKVNRFEELAHTKPKRLYTVKDGLPEKIVFRLFEDSRGDIWIGAIGNRISSLARWERATDKIHAYTVKDNLFENNWPTAFGEDHAGNIWIGYYGSGLIRYRQGYFQQFSEKEDLPEGFIRDIYTDSTGRIWIANATSGVIRIDDPDAESPKLVNISTLEGLSSNQTTCITEDRFGYIYIGTGRGVNRLNTQTGRIKLFTEADGLIGNYVHVCKTDKTGALWFGSFRGVARYIAEPDLQTVPPAIFIADLRVNGETFNKLSELGETKVENLELASDQRQVQINFFALSFSTGENLRYQYKLDNAEWSDPGELRTVNLTLSPGDYHFLVRAINAEGIVSENSALVAFSIARPIWQRWWFLSTALLLSGLTIYGFYGYRLKRLLELERVRTRIATDLHDDIGSNLSLIAMVSEVAKQQASQDNRQVAESLALVSRTSRQSVDAMSDIVWAVNPKRDHLHDLTERMRRFASDSFAARDIDFEFHHPEEKQNIKLGTEIRKQVYLIFKESVNNIAKHSECTEAEIKLSMTQGELWLSIRDNGKGFDVEHQSNGYGGNGLRSMQERAESLGGKLEVQSQKQQGSMIRLKIPLRRGQI